MKGDGRIVGLPVEMSEYIVYQILEPGGGGEEGDREGVMHEWRREEEGGRSVEEEGAEELKEEWEDAREGGGVEGRETEEALEMPEERGGGEGEGGGEVMMREGREKEDEDRQGEAWVGEEVLTVVASAWMVLVAAMRRCEGSYRRGLTRARDGVMEVAGTVVGGLMGIAWVSSHLLLCVMLVREVTVKSQTVHVCRAVWTELFEEDARGEQDGDGRAEGGTDARGTEDGDEERAGAGDDGSVDDGEEGGGGDAVSNVGGDAWVAADDDDDKDGGDDGDGAAREGGGEGLEAERSAQEEWARRALQDLQDERDGRDLEVYDRLEEDIVERILEPTIDGAAQEGTMEAWFRLWWITSADGWEGRMSGGLRRRCDEIEVWKYVAGRMKQEMLGMEGAGSEEEEAGEEEEEEEASDIDDEVDVEYPAME